MAAECGACRIRVGAAAVGRLQQCVAVRGRRFAGLGPWGSDEQHVGVVGRVARRGWRVWGASVGVGGFRCAFHRGDRTTRAVAVIIPSLARSTVSVHDRAVLVRNARTRGARARSGGVVWFRRGGARFARRCGSRPGQCQRPTRHVRRGCIQLPYLPGHPRAARHVRVRPPIMPRLLRPAPRVRTDARVGGHHRTSVLPDWKVCAAAACAGGGHGALRDGEKRLWRRPRGDVRR